MKLIISSYNNNDYALSLFDINIKNKEYKLLDHIELIEPSFVIASNGYIFTYTKRPLELLAFNIVNNKYNLLDRISVPLETMTHLLFNEENNTLYGASYKDGSIVKVSFINNKFSNLKVVHEGGKCHEVLIHEKKIGIINIEKDIYSIYDLDLNYLDSISLPTKTGARHGLWDKDILYIVTEYSNELFKIENKTLVDRIKTIKGTSKSNCATLLMDSNYIYVSNRGEDTIARISYKDKLKYIDNHEVFGMHSRHMIFDNTNNYIISLNKNSNNIAIIDTNTFELVLNIPYDKCSGVAIYNI